MLKLILWLLSFLLETRDMILKMLLKDTIQEKNISKTLSAMIAMIDLSIQFKVLMKNNIN